MNLPKDLDRYVLLYLYDELDHEEKEAFETHIANDEGSRQKLEEMRALHKLLDRKLVFEPSIQALSQARANLRERLRDERRKKLKESWWQKLYAHWAFRGRVFQMAGAVLLLLIGFLIGRFSFSDTGYRNISSGGFVAAALDAPSFIASIDMIQYEPETGAVTVHYKRVQDVSLQGDIEDEGIRRVLSHAIRTDHHPGRRLAAVKASAGRRFRDAELEDALIFAMERDEVDGVRLRAAKTLKGLPISEKVKAAFIRVLLSDTNPAIRMEALNTLSKVDEQDVYPVFQDASRDDDNEFVRLQAARALQRIERVDAVESR